MLHSIAAVLFLLIIVLAFISPKWSVILFMAHKILIPVNNLTIGAFLLFSNHLVMLMLIGFVARYFGRLVNKGKSVWIPFYLFILYYLYVLFVSMLGWDAQLITGFVRSDILTVLIVPFIIINISSIEPRNISFFQISMCCICAISIIYAIVLIPFHGLNPYSLLLTDITGTEISERWLTDESRIFGRITSTFAHAMYYAAFVCFSGVFYLFMFTKYKSKLSLVMFALSLVSIVTCGVRSAIFGIGVAVIYYLYVSGFKQIVKYSILGIVALLVMGTFSPMLYEYIISPLVDSDRTDIGGSSIEMRTRQIYGAFDEIHENFLLGHGYGWTTYYLARFGGHSTLLGFESLITKQLCEGGIIGCFAFAILYYKLFKCSYINCNIEKLFLQMLILSYIAYTISTGDYLYSAYFMLFYSVIYISIFEDDKALSL